jgi:hypothetical protein
MTQRGSTAAIQRSDVISIARSWYATACPFLAPEIVLLYKSKAPRPTDEADFRVALPALTTEQRDWLRLAIAEMRPDPV